MDSISNVNRGALPVNNTIYQSLDPYHVTNARWGVASHSGYDKIPNSLRGLFVNKEALITDAETKLNVPFVGARAVYRNPNYTGLGNGERTRIGIGYGLGNLPQRSDDDFVNGYTKRPLIPNRSVYPIQFNHYNGFNLDQVKRMKRDEEVYIDEDIAMKYARDRIANVSSSHNAFLYRDPYEQIWHQPYTEANTKL